MELIPMILSSIEVRGGDSWPSTAVDGKSRNELPTKINSSKSGPQEIS